MPATRPAPTLYSDYIRYFFDAHGTNLMGATSATAAGFLFRRLGFFIRLFLVGFLGIFRLFTVVGAHGTVSLTASATGSGTFFLVGTNCAVRLAASTTAGVHCSGQPASSR